VSAAETAAWRSPELQAAATTPADEVLRALDSTRDGLSTGEASRRLAAVGPNALRSHGVRALEVFARQLRNPLLALLVSAALVSAFVGEATDAFIILTIICLSVVLGFANEYRSARAVEALHSRLRHTALTLRDGRPVSVDVTELVPGDVVRLGVGDVVPADVRLLELEGWSATSRCSPARPCRWRSRSRPSSRPSRRWRSPPARSWAPSCSTAAGRAS